MAKYEKSFTTALHAQTSSGYRHGVNCKASQSHTICDAAPAQASTYTPWEDTSSPSPPHADSHTALTWAPVCEQDPINGRRPPAATGTNPPHPCHCPGSRRPRTPHERTPHAGTVQVHRPSHVRKDCPGNKVFCIWQPCARDAGNKIAVSQWLFQGCCSGGRLGH